MENFLILVKGGKGVNPKDLTTETRNEYIKLWGSWLRSLKRKGILVAGSQLAAGGTWISGINKEEKVPDNYDMASDVVTGFIVVTAADEFKARDIAEGCPFLFDPFTSCEIRTCK